MPQNDEKEYWVLCIDCGAVFKPEPRSPLWWKAKQRSEKGQNTYIDGGECSYNPKETVQSPDAPFRVFGYDMLCENFDIPFYRMTDALKTFIELNRGPDIVFISGVSDAVQDRLHYFTR